MIHVWKIACLKFLNGKQRIFSVVKECRINNVNCLEEYVKKYNKIYFFYLILHLETSECTERGDNKNKF